MPKIKVVDLAYIRLASPDLDVAQTFLTDFGMVCAQRDAETLYMRGTDAQAYLHVTERGPSRMVGFGFNAASASDLQALAQTDGASAVADLDAPGGGQCVRLTDPNGYRIDVVHGIVPAAPLAVREHVGNFGRDRRRKGSFTRFARGPSQVKRIGHGVLMSTDLKTTVSWYRENLGFIASDEIFAGTPDNIIGSFNRADRGDDYVDHHILFCIQGTKNGLQHISFEVQDVDDVMIGHEYLKAKGYEHAWGIGRHILGSQIFDYWMDPWQRIHEHWTDGDLFNAANPPTLESIEAGGLESQWGEDAPAAFVVHAIP